MATTTILTIMLVSSRATTFPNNRYNWKAKRLSNFQTRAYDNGEYAHYVYFHVFPTLRELMAIFTYRKGSSSSIIGKS